METEKFGYVTSQGNEIAYVAVGAARHDLLIMPGGFGGMGVMSDHDQRAARLMTIITTNVEPQSWQVSDPSANSAGAVSEYNGLIVVTQTAQTHKKIEHVLDMLRHEHGNKVHAARALGISRRALYRLIDKHRLRAEDYTS